MMKSALTLNNITKKYQDGDSERTILNDVSLKVEYGEFVAIVGPSGSGKSTLLSIAGALLSPTSGSVTIGDSPVGTHKKQWTKIRQNQIGFIFQSHQLLSYLTVEDQLNLILKTGDNDTAEGRAFAKQLLVDMELSHRAHAYPKKLSGGEKQRVAIARAFLNKPDVILADEPTASLDEQRGRYVVERIRDEVKKQHKAAIMVTHDERILDLVDTVYRIENGRLLRVSDSQ